MGFFSNLFNKKNQPVKTPKVDVEKIVSEIRQKEINSKVPLGKKIHSFEYGELEIRFDRDITHNGRFCVFNGSERIYSFTVFAKEGETDILKDALETIIEFLNGDRNIKDLPDSESFKGFYYGNN